MQEMESEYLFLPLVYVRNCTRGNLGLSLRRGRGAPHEESQDDITPSSWQEKSKQQQEVFHMAACVGSDCPSSTLVCLGGFFAPSALSSSVGF